MRRAIAALAAIAVATVVLFVKGTSVGPERPVPLVSLVVCVWWGLPYWVYAIANLSFAGSLLLGLFLPGYTALALHGIYTSNSSTAAVGLVVFPAWLLILLGLMRLRLGPPRSVLALAE